MNVKLLLFAVGLTLGFSSVPACAKTEDELRQVEQEFNEKKKEQEALGAAANKASEGLDALRQRMIRATHTLQDKELEQEGLEEKLERLTQDIVDKREVVSEERHRLSLMVSVLVEISSRPPVSLFLKDKIRADHIHRSLLLQAILPRLKHDTESAAADLASLYDLQEELTRHERLVVAARENLKKQKHDLDQMIATRQGFLKRTEEQKAQTARHLAQLAEQARDLRQLMAKVAAQRRAPKTQPPVAKNVVPLKWPVSGPVRKNFGEKDGDGVVSQGVTVAAPSGAPVVAPHAGRVVFAGPFRGYGQIIILQHDNGYYSFLSGFGRIDSDMGQRVEAGEPLGVLPVKSGTKPELYFEWRQGDRPLNPKDGLERRS